MNTLSLVEEAIRLRDKEGGDFDQCWCVFDRDSFPVADFDNAVSKATANDFKVAYSNEAFELWYLLHFIYCDARIGRQHYCDKLGHHFSQPYDKTVSYYRVLLSKQNTALQNATMLMSRYEDKHKPHECSPGTTVHLLVQELNKNVP